LKSPHSPPIFTIQVPETMKLTFFAILISVFSIGCSSVKKIDREYAPVGFSEVEAPEILDYSLAANWAALPTVEDGADVLPEGFEDGQATAQVDVFFVHPTTFMYTDSGWNAGPNDAIALDITTDKVLPNQASVFNGVGRIYAPHYRQAHLKSYFNLQSGGYEALLLAYSDVRRAFLYYLEHYNEGRPFILASHSQGTTHSIVLIDELIDGKALQEQLVAAYLIGMPVPKDTFQVLPPCDAPGDFGCYSSWCTYVKGFEPKTYDSFFKGANVTHPISWKLNDSTYNALDEHKGILYFDYELKYKETVFSTTHDGILWMKKPRVWWRFLLLRKN